MTDYSERASDLSELQRLAAKLGAVVMFDPQKPPPEPEDALRPILHLHHTEVVAMRWVGLAECPLCSRVERFQTNGAPGLIALDIACRCGATLAFRIHVEFQA